ncbi:hypothetical protein EDD21DRAFT_131358 [Dissophora ornata]|nr:hypothetical protein EDD21DRAFT_131358 [Dissophora ornata]
MRPSTLATYVFGLPEIRFQIALYLDAVDVLACSKVSRTFYASFTPLVWIDLHFGKSCVIDRQKSPLGRFVVIPDTLTTISPSEVHENDEEGPNNPLLEILQRNAPWVRSLTIQDHNSVFPLIAGRAFTRLESITLEGLRWEKTEKHEAAYWKTCRELMYRNKSQLRSLTLSNWTFPYSKPLPGQPRWNPILKCTQSWNLRSLNLQKCSIRGQHLSALWKICERLEALTMEFCQIDLTMRPVVLHKKGSENKEKAKVASKTTKTPDESTPSSQPPRFPLLKDLTLERNVSRPIQELNLLIGQCPRLETLHWNIERRLLPQEEFLTLCEASNWPELDSITFRGNCSRISNQSFGRFLRATRKPMRRIDSMIDAIDALSYNELRSRHFATIEVIDLSRGSEVKQEWVNEVLTSCPNLQKFVAKCIRAQDMLKMPWACLGLQELIAFIDMGFPDNGPHRKLTEEELEQCRAVYKHLAALKELRVLDMLSGYLGLRASSEVPHSDPLHLRHFLVPLPMRLEAGLDLLASSKNLEKVSFYGGRHVVHKKTLVWMVAHWKRLGALSGRWRIQQGTAKEVVDRYFWHGKLRWWLEQRGVNTCHSFYDESPNEEFNGVDCGDCCALSDDE